MAWKHISGVVEVSEYGGGRPDNELPSGGGGGALVDLRPGRIRLAAHACTAVDRQNAHPKPP